MNKRQNGYEQTFGLWMVAILVMALLAGTSWGQTLDGEYIVTLAPSEASPAAAAEAFTNQFGGEVSFVYEHALRGFAVTGLQPDDAARLAASSSVIGVEKNVSVRSSQAGTQEEPNWNLDRIDQRLQPLDGRYAFAHQGSGSTIYVLDTGIRTTHSEFQGRASWGIDCTGEGRVDDNGHGTHVAGIAGGTRFGVAKGARLIAVKVLGKTGKGSLASLLCGMDWVAGQGQDTTTVATAAVSVPFNDLVTEVLSASVERGVFYALAAGNDRLDICSEGFPGLPGALVVASSDIKDQKSPFSNYGACIDLFAPGDRVYSSWYTSDFAATTLTGTSGAAAHVAGAAAQWLEADSSIKPAQLAEGILDRATVGRIVDPMGTPNLLLAKLIDRPIVIESIRPEVQFVGRPIQISGSGFGGFQATTSRINFTDGRTTWTASLPVVWRDDYIEVNIPTGDTVDGEAIPMVPGRVFVQIVADGLVSDFGLTQVGGTSSGSLPMFQEVTSIDANDCDISTVLGNPNHNKARTKEADIADIDGDGDMDILDNNSNNQGNSTHGILRLNDGTGQFTAVLLEPLSNSDPGTFATHVTPSGIFFQNGVSYDADIFDIDNDSYPDILQTATLGGTVNHVRVLMNNQPNPGDFLEQTAVRMPTNAISGGGCPDDLAHADVNCDGYQDFAITLRLNGACTPPPMSVSQTRLFFNLGASNPGIFGAPQIFNAPGTISTHDVFFIDVNDDMAADMFIVNENGSQSELWLHDGNFGNPQFSLSVSFPVNAFSGEPADFNGDGHLDFVVVGSGLARVYLNDPMNPGSFPTSVNLPSPGPGSHYDVELGDLDDDGDIDIVSAAITGNGENTIRIWSNDGAAAFINETDPGASAVLPGIGDFQRLSADLIDMDGDGDLDLYIVGADGQSVAPGFGRVPNQLFENLLY